MHNILLIIFNEHDVLEKIIHSHVLCPDDTYGRIFFKISISMIYDDAQFFLEQNIFSRWFT